MGKRNVYKGWACIVVAGVLLAGCGKDGEEPCEFSPDLSAVVADFAFEALEDSLPALKTKEQLAAFFQRHPGLRDGFFMANQYPSEEIFLQRWHERFTHPAIDTLRLETRQIFSEYNLRQQFREAFATIRHYYPDFRIPKVQTIITGLETDLWVSDTLIVVGLDYFMGPKARYKPDLYTYMQRRYRPEFIVPSVLLLYGIDSKTNATDLADRTLLSDMISYGKAYYFAKRMVPCVPDSILMGYSAQEIVDARHNRSVIWKKLLEQEVLFATDQRTRQKYIFERPKTYEIADQCPGRIGTWVGWEIVRAYMQRHPDVTLPELMALADARKIWEESKFKP